MSLTIRSGVFLSSTLLALGAGIAFAKAGNVSGEFAFESRNFIEEGLQEQKQWQPSVRGEIEYKTNTDTNYFNVKLFGRADQQDTERTHVDIREAYWTHVGNAWELKAGISKVFWGVTESRHLVDVINQTDLVENIDAEDKLGQPMFKLGLEREWGNLDLFWLPYFREKTFVGKDGRLNAFPVVINTDDAQFESSADNWHSDFAFRYSTRINDLDVALSHFSGTSRNPLIQFNGNFLAPGFQPYYVQIDQTGLELQYIYEDWLWKLEGVTSSGEYQRYSAAVFGFEYTQVGICDSSADLGWIVEYMFDDRHGHPNSSAKAAPHSFERDIFLGWRYAFNDADSTELLAGIIYDPQTEESLYSLEYSKRLASDLKLNLELRAFQGAEQDSNLKTFYLRDEDYLQLELVKFF